MTPKLKLPAICQDCCGTVEFMMTELELCLAKLDLSILTNKKSPNHKARTEFKQAIKIKRIELMAIQDYFYANNFDDEELSERCSNVPVYKKTFENLKNQIIVY